MVIADVNVQLLLLAILVAVWCRAQCRWHCRNCRHERYCIFLFFKDVSS